MNFENICTEKEAQFLLNNLKPTDNILEYGNGDLSLQIADKVRHVSVITHDLNSYGKIIENKPENIEILHVPTNIPQTSDDGNYNEFKDYIEAPKELLNRFGKFNVIIIRGRARVECAKFAKNIAQEGCKIFVLDYAHPNPEYTRNEYFEIEKHLTKTGWEFTMCSFSIEYDPEQFQQDVQQMIDEITESETTITNEDNNTHIVKDLHKNKEATKPFKKKVGGEKLKQLSKNEQNRVKGVAKKIAKIKK